MDTQNMKEDNAFHYIGELVPVATGFFAFGTLRLHGILLSFIDLFARGGVWYGQLGWYCCPHVEPILSHDNHSIESRHGMLAAKAKGCRTV